MFTIAIHFYRLSCECKPRVYESLVAVLSTQCVKSFNRALHSALHGQYGKPKFRAKQACLNLQHKISSHHLVHFNDTQRSSILLPIFLFIFTLLWIFFSIMVRLTDVQRGRAIALRMQGQRQQQVANHFGVNVSTIERLVRRLKGDRAFSRPTAVWASTRDVATSRQDNSSGTFAESSSHCYRNCP